MLFSKHFWASFSSFSGQNMQGGHKLVKFLQISCLDYKQMPGGDFGTSDGALCDIGLTFFCMLGSNFNHQILVDYGTWVHKINH